MATGTGKWYGQVLGGAFNKEIDLVGTPDTLKVTLHTSTYTPDLDNHDFQNDLTNEVAGTGYTAGGKTLTTVTFTYTAGTNTWKLDADDVSWTGSTITARYAVVADTTPGTAATNRLLVLVDFGADVVSSGGNFDITWDAAGIAYATIT
ncbi:MAG: hypothetical protein AB7U23_12520 [Dehalococcoidia bacterium]